MHLVPRKFSVLGKAAVDSWKELIRLDKNRGLSFRLFLDWVVRVFSLESDENLILVKVTYKAWARTHFSVWTSEVLWEGASGALGAHQFKHHQCPIHKIRNSVPQSLICCLLVLSGHGGKILRLLRHLAGLFISSVSMRL